MTICTCCGIKDGGSTTIELDGEEYELCKECGTEEPMRYVDEDEYYSELEYESRIDYWKDNK